MASEEKQRQLGRSLAAIAVLFLCFWAFSGPSLLVRRVVLSKDWSSLPALAWFWLCGAAKPGE